MHSAAPSFPARLAAIDVGSNAIRLLAGEFSGLSHWRELHSERAPVRLGEEAFRAGRLSEEAMERGLGALAGFRRRLDESRVPYYRAVATSAVRESGNGSEFARRVKERCGLELEAIDGAEEARLSWVAIRRRVALRDRAWLVMDLGGGSLELSLVDAERLHWTESYPLGTVRLLERVGGARDADAAREAVGATEAMHGAAEAVRRAGSVGLIATGGNAETLAGLARPSRDGLGVQRLPLSRLRELLEGLAALSPRERTERHGLRPDRADVIVPAAAVYERVAVHAGVEEILVPVVGVREGLLLDTADRLFRSATPAEEARP
jgi:exopolyphosphatase/guanosine-5'-triphosphate,3'-diphosphate pyrophosphatase